MTPEQQRAIAIARARKRKSEATSGNPGREQPAPIQGQQDHARYLGNLIDFTQKGNTGRATAAAIGAANSSTLGALDPLYDSLERTDLGTQGPSSGDIRRMLRKEHPVSSTVGEIAGFAAPGSAIWKGGQTVAKALPQLPGKAAPYTARLLGLAGMGGAESAAYQSTVGASNVAAETGEPVTIPERLEMAKAGATDPLALAAGPALSLAGRGLQGMFTGRVTPKHLQPQANAPTLDEIGDMRDAAYKATDEMGVAYSPEGLQEMAVSLSQKLDSVNIDQHLHPRAHRVKEILQEKVQTGMSLPQLDNLRKFVRNNVVASNEPSEKMLGRMMIDEIDGFINSGKHAVTGSGDDAAEAIVGARNLHQVHSKGQQIADAEQAASLRASSTGSGGNYENALRQELRKIYQNPKRIAGFTPEERASMLKVIKGDPVQNLMRNVGKLSPQGNGLMSALGIGTTAANPWLAPVWFAGMGAKHLAERGVRNKFDDLDKLVRSAAEVPPMKNITPPKTPPSGAVPPASSGPNLSPPARVTEQIPESAYTPQAARQASQGVPRMARPEQPTTLTSAVKNLGGIKTRYGNFQENLSRGEFESVPGLIHDKGGQSADDIVRALQEDGFDIVDENDLYRALNNERAGQKTYRIGEGEEYEVMLDAYNSRPASPQAAVASGAPAGGDDFAVSTRTIPGERGFMGRRLSPDSERFDYSFQTSGGNDIAVSTGQLDKDGTFFIDWTTNGVISSARPEGMPTQSLGETQEILSGVERAVQRIIADKSPSKIVMAPSSDQHARIYRAMLEKADLGPYTLGQEMTQGGPALVLTRSDGAGARGSSGILGNQNGSIDTGGGPRRRRDVVRDAMRQSQGEVTQRAGQVPPMRPPPPPQRSRGVMDSPLPVVAGAGLAGVGTIEAAKHFSNPQAATQPPGGPSPFLSNLTSSVNQAIGSERQRSANGLPHTPGLKPDLSEAAESVQHRANTEAWQAERGRRAKFYSWIRENGAPGDGLMWTRAHEKRANDLRITPNDRRLGIKDKRLVYGYEAPLSELENAPIELLIDGQWIPESALEGAR